MVHDVGRRRNRCTTGARAAMIGATMDGMVVGANDQVWRGDASVLLTCEHASCAVPDDLRGLGLAPAVLDEHWGWDRWALDVVRRTAPRLDATVVASCVSRLVVDVNRAPGDPTLALARCDGREVPGNLGLTPAQVEARVARFHAPYHAAVDAELRRLVARHGAGAVVLVSVHSFTGAWAGQDRDFDVGVLFDRHEDLAVSLRDAFLARGLRARLNEPYSGLAGLIYAAKRHGDAHGVRYVELELNQHVLECPQARERVASHLETVLRERLLATPEGRTP
jgi:predicted N-formylglutamate amidohydrolase